MQGPTGDILARISVPPATGSAAVDPRELARRLGLRSEALAARILACFDDDGDGTVPHAELVARVEALTRAPAEERLRFAFRLHDEDGNGTIDRDELLRMLHLSIAENQLVVASEMVDALADALFSSADTNRDGRLDFAELERALAGYPGVLEHLTRADLMGLGIGAEARPEREGAGPVARAIAAVRSEASWVLLVGLYVGTTLALGIEAFLRYRAAGAPLPVQIARFCGAALNFHGAIVLLPMCRATLTFLGRTPLGRFLVDDHVAFHRLVGNVGLVLTIAHTAAHVTNAALGPAGLSALATWAGVTGLLLTIVYLVMWVFAQDRIRRSGRFELFRRTHLLWPLWLALLLAHGPVAWQWMAGPLLLFLVDRFVLRRAVRTRATRAEVLPSGVTRLRLERPEGFEFAPADYVLVRIPEIARGEWHPFTISSAPERRDELTLHVRRAGNWTGALHDLAARHRRTDPPIEVWLDGPHGAPSAHALSSRRVVLCAAGIGVTPFASLLESLLERIASGDEVPVDKVHFIWVCRQQDAFEWFSDVLGRLEDAAPGRVELHIHMDGARGGLGSSVLRAAMDCLYASLRADLVTGLRARTTFGPPDWDATIASIAEAHAPERVDCFYCGPGPLALVVKAACERHGVPFRQEHF